MDDNSIDNLLKLHGHDNIMKLIDKHRDERFRIDFQKGRAIRKRVRKSIDTTEPQASAQDSPVDIKVETME